jgi:hypothetical protein
MTYQENNTHVKQQPEFIEGRGYKVKGIKHNQGFEHIFPTMEEARGFIKGFTFAFIRNLVA